LRRQLYKEAEMKETDFIKRYSDRWKEAESLLKSRLSVSPETIAKHYTEISDDLSYSATFFPESQTTLYLNNLASAFHRTIYSRKFEKRSRLITFWKNEQPLLIRKHARSLITAFLIFSFAVFIGALSSRYDKRFSRVVLGETYTRMTEQNIENEDPLAVYKQSHQINMFLGITFNNIRVALTVFALGVLLSAGSAILLFYNGIMIGTFHYIFYEHNLLAESLKTVWIHGSLEIPAIIIAAGAGIVIGNSVLFPGTFSRTHSFQTGAADGLKLLIGVLPLFVVAGFLEGFVTRLTELPDFIRLFIIFISLGFILFFYLIYPLYYGGHYKTITLQKQTQNSEPDADRQC
jgi:uncharacterized membrane protein SpoIIM required for sporulation